MRTVIGCLVLGMVLAGCNILTPSLSPTDCEVDARWQHDGLSTWFILDRDSLERYPEKWAWVNATPNTFDGDSLELYPRVIVADDSSSMGLRFTYYGETGASDFHLSVPLPPETGYLDMEARRVLLHVVSGDVMEEIFRVVEGVPSIVEIHTIDFGANTLTGTVDITLEVDSEMVETYGQGRRRSALPERFRLQADYFTARIWNSTYSQQRWSEMTECWLETGQGDFSMSG